MIKFILILMLIAGLYQTGRGWLLKNNKDFSDETFEEIKSMTEDKYNKLKDEIFTYEIVYTLIILLLLILSF